MAKMTVKFVTDKNGRKRAYKYSTKQMRWFPMPVDEAELAVATGEATKWKGK